jgi:hypothetical protein
LGIVTEYPLGFIFFCFLLGVTYAFILYFRTQNQIVVRWQRWLMSLLRFIAVFLISFLLLSPLIKRRSEIIDKPLIIFAQDNSLSIALSKDSSFYRKEYPNAVRKLQEQLSKEYDFSMLSFAERITPELKTTFSEKITDISSVIDEVNTRYANRNIGALIISSDGIYNRGSNPFYAAQKIRFPVYTVGMGDTSFHRDIILKKITYNHSVFAGDKFPVEILIAADRCAGEKSEIQVKKGNQVLFSKPVQFKGEKDFQRINLLLEAKEKGIQRYTVTIRQVDKETTIKNNNRDFFVEVFDTREKILIIYQSPHPDIAAFKHALEGTAKFEITESKLDEFIQPVANYDLVILDQLPSDNSNLKKFIDSRASLLFIIGAQTNLDALNNLRTGLVINSDHNNIIESLPAFNESFPLFTINNDIKEMLKNAPPLISPFGQYLNSPMADVMIYQKIGTTKSHYPMLMFVQTAGRKTGFIAGENVWKWRLSDYLQNGNHDTFDEFINKIVQYLSVKGDQNFFRVKCENTFQENENVEMEAEVYNESYELINQQDVNLTITDEKNKSFPYVFGKTEKGYYLNAGNFPTGTYKYVASVKVGKNFYQKKGEFIVAPLNLEELSTNADFNVLFRIAKAHDGELVSPHDLDGLANKISKREDIKPVSYFQKRYSDIIGNIWVFVLILILLSAEWFMRKRSGVY